MAELRAPDTITGSLARCYVTIDGNRYLLIQAKKVEAKVEKTKTEISILGKTGKGNKSTGWKGTGSFVLYDTTSLFRELMEQYKNTGEDVYFDMQVENEDPSSKTGRQVAMLLNCNINSLTIAQLDVDSAALEDTVEFTFEDFKLPEKFNQLDGMAQ